MAYLTADEIRSGAQPLSPLSNPQEFTDEQLEEYVAEFEEVAENYCGVAFEPRTVTGETYLVTGRDVFLAWMPVTTLTTVTVDGVTLTSDDYEFDKRLGILRLGSAQRDATVAVTYTHGLSAPPQALLRACRKYVQSVALADTSDTPRDAIATSAEGVTLRFSTPDREAGRPTGFMEVDRLLNSLPNYSAPGQA